MHRFILSRKYDVPVGFVFPPILKMCIPLMRSLKDGCCSISDDLSCTYFVDLFDLEQSIVLFWSFYFVPFVFVGSIVINRGKHVRRRVQKSHEGS